MTIPLPPRNRGRAARRLTAAAALGRFELPMCDDCKTFQFPVKEICGVCLSANLIWRSAPDRGKVLANTSIHHSVDFYMQQRAPVPMGSVQLDQGPVVMAFIAAGCDAPGTRVRILNRLDRSGESVLSAVPANASEDVMVLHDPNRDIAGKAVWINGNDDAVSQALVGAFKHAGAVKALLGPYSSTSEPVDILVNNLSSNGRTSLLDAASTDLARDEMESNYFRLIEAVRAAVPAMRHRGSGIVLNILSVFGQVADPTMGSYSASQAAALAATRVLRAEVMPFGVRVCGLFHDVIDKPENVSIAPPKLSPRSLAQAAIKMIREGFEDHYPGTAADLNAAFFESQKTVEREMAQRLG